ncbi:serine/threonine-protein kinase [Actinosynnema sp. CS-041913]|uniref:serine/threonine-protein kinase n=1 Tax=Actinosynnema sp. CS-041913 TaxID=3239917 RepID=UPI003D8EB7D9
MAQQPAGAAPGRVVGDRYRLVEALDFGGMGRVWKARDEALHIDVAVKEVWLSPGMSAAERDERLARARREARNAAVLRDHPNIVAVHDVVVEEGVPWIVMRLVAGRSLDKRLEEGPLSAEEATRVASDLLDALEAAHGVGIVHRDVKPANVLLADNGDTLLADFGISVHHTDTAITVTGTLIGSVEYMAPERLNGKDGLPESDLYSLGVTLFQAVEGRSPFRRDTPTATLTAVLLEPMPPLSRAGNLATLITGLLARDPAGRPTFAEARARLAAPPTPTAKIPQPPPRPTEVIRPPQGPATARRSPAVALGLVIALVVVGLVVFRSQLIDGLDAAVDELNSSSDTTTRTTTTTRSPLTQAATRERATSERRPTRTTTTTPAFDPADLDDKSTDDTPLTTAALLAQSFTDSKDVGYTREGADVRECVTEYLSQEVRDLLVRSGCRDAVTGTYVDKSGRILVMVWVVPMADDRTAKAAYEAYDSASWGILCPKNGPGSEICDRDLDTRGAVQRGHTRRTHRYLIHSTALYINLTGDRSVAPWLESAAKEAVLSAGPENHSGNR